jgi:hypothetical protein
MTNEQKSEYLHIARIIEEFALSMDPGWDRAASTTGAYDMDDYVVNTQHKDPVLDRVSRECAAALRSGSDGHYTKAGLNRLKEIAQELRAIAESGE